MLSTTRGSPVTLAPPAVPGPNAAPADNTATEFEPTPARRGSHTAAGDSKILPPQPPVPRNRSEQHPAEAWIPDRTWICPTCEHALRVSGGGRHRVYFELTDELADDPVMDRACPGCGQGLPGKNPPSSPWIQAAPAPSI